MSERKAIKTLVASVALSLLEATACASGGSPTVSKEALLRPTPHSQTLDVAISPGRTNATLATTLSAELIDKLGLQKLANSRVNVYSIATSDKKPTYVYLYDRSVDIDPNAFEAAYESVSPIGLARYVEGLRQDTQHRIDPTDGIIFPYQYGNDSEQAEIGIHSASPITEARHMLFLDPQSIPSWATSVSAVTRLLPPPGTTKDQDTTFVSIVSVARYNSQLSLNRAVLTEICQQSVLALYFIGRGEIASQDSVQAAISQEGVCNGIGAAAVLKRADYPVDQTIARTRTSVQAETLGIPHLRYLRLFPTTELALAALPNEKRALVEVNR